MFDPLAALEGRRWPPVVGADPVSAPDVRRFLEVLEWSEPLPAGTAPAASAPAFAMAPYWTPGDPPATPDSPPLFPDLPFLRELPPEVEVFNAGFVREIVAPVELGDALTATWSVGRAVPKLTRVGPGAFVDVTAEYAGRAGVLSRGHLTLFLYLPGAGSEPAPPVAPGRGAPLRLAITHGPQRMAMWTAANRDFALIHVDREYARAAGAPDVFANTFFVEALYERLLRGWIGADGAIERIAFRMHTFLGPARSVDVLGWPDGDRVRLQQVAEGVVTSSGEAVVRRAAGSTGGAARA